MASIVLGSAAAAVGNSILPGIGGAFFGVIGRAAGNVIDSTLGLGGNATGPRLDNLSVQDSRYGAGMPIVYGDARVAGNVIWSTDLIQAQHTQSIGGGKGGALGGGATETTYTYSVHCAVGIALGPIGGIATIWADSNVIYQNGAWASGVVDSAGFYLGTSAQNPDPFMQSMLGSGNVPAYRGLAYVVFENLQLANFGNRLPNLTFEVSPSTETNNPQWLGEVDAGVDQLPPATQCGGIRPLVLSSAGGDVQTVLVGGVVPSGSTCVFEVVEYDVTGPAPVEMARTSSASFSISTPLADISWAMAPDGRFVALYLQCRAAPTHNFIIYDAEAQAFGPIATPNVAADSGTKALAWIDEQHVVIDDVSSGVRGLHVLARAGLGLVDCGFFGVWGAGSASSRLPIFHAQFTPFAGGLVQYMGDGFTGTSYFTNIYACCLVWRGNALVAGTPYILAGGVSTGIGAGAHANLIETGDGEWTLCFGTVVDFHLISFEPGISSAAITRAWQGFTPSGSNGGTQCPVLFGDRLVIVQVHNFTNTYWLSEVLLGSGTYTLMVDGFTASTSVNNSVAIATSYNAISLDGVRLLLGGLNIPNFDVQQLGIIQRCLTGDGLDAIMSDILTRAGYASGDYDVTALAGTSISGFVLPGPMTPRAAIEPLQVFAPFDLVESASELKAVVRHGTADVAIASSEWRAVQEKTEPPPPLQVMRAQELDLPVEVDVDYIDSTRNFEVNSQRARRTATYAINIQKINLPIVSDPDTAKQVAETRLYALWAERDLVKLSVSRRWLMLDPGDVIDLGNGNLLRVTNINQAGGLMEIEGFYVNASVYLSTASADSGQVPTLNFIAPEPSTLYLMDLPLLQSTDNQPGVYAAASGLPGWNGASLWRAPDGVNYSDIASLPSMATAGIATTALPNGPGFYLDSVSTVNVQLLNGELSSCALIDLYNGANAAMLGNEVVQFMTATLIGPGFYTLSNLLRGRRGTEFTTGTHAIGESFVLLQAGAVDFVPALLTDRGVTYEFRALSNGETLGDVQDTDFTYSLATLRPFSPANVTGARANGIGSDLTVSWFRRARFNAEWVDYIDVPLDQPAELYDVDIMNGTSVVRTFSSLPSPGLTYTAAEQSADWGSGIPATFMLNVYQIGASYGRGEVASATL